MRRRQRRANDRVVVAGGNLPAEFAVSREVLEPVELVGGDPAQFGIVRRVYGTAPLPYDIVVDLEQVFAIPVSPTLKKIGGDDRDSELLAQLAVKRLDRLLELLDLPAGKLPETSERLSFRSLCQEHSPRSINQYCRRYPSYASHGAP